MNNYSEPFYPDSGFTDDLKSAFKLEPHLQNTNSYEMQEDGIYQRLGATPLASDYDSPLLSSTPSPYMMDNSNSATEAPFNQGLDYLSHEFDDIARLLTTDSDSSFPVALDDISNNVDIAITTTDYLDDYDESTLEDSLFRGDSPMLGSNSSSLSPQCLGATAYSPEPALYASTPALTASGHQPRKPRRKAAAKAVQGFTQLEELSTIDHEPLYLDTTALGVPSPAPSTSSSCGFSDAYVSEEAPHTGRKRRPRVSYQTLTEEEKYKRIRDLNNEASKNYRERQKGQLTKLEQQIPGLEDKNRRLKAKEAGLVKLLGQMKLYQENLFRQQMNSNSQDNIFRQQMNTSNNNSGTLTFNQF